MAGERVLAAAGPWCPEAQRPVKPARDDRVPIGAEAPSRDAALMACEDLHAVPIVREPHPDGPIRSSRQHNPAARVPVDPFHVRRAVKAPHLRAKISKLLVLARAPQLEHAAEIAGGQHARVVAEANRSHGLRVRAQHLLLQRGPLPAPERRGVVSTAGGEQAASMQAARHGHGVHGVRMAGQHQSRVVLQGLHGPLLLSRAVVVGLRHVLVVTLVWRRLADVYLPNHIVRMQKDGVLRPRARQSRSAGRARSGPPLTWSGGASASSAWKSDMRETPRSCEPGAAVPACSPLRPLRRRHRRPPREPAVQLACVFEILKFGSTMCPSNRCGYCFKTLFEAD
eukprot:scaffold576_cov260-Pinguiococcus_pyrenoidosus.AAC.70